MLLVDLVLDDESHRFVIGFVRTIADDLPKVGEKEQVYLVKLIEHMMMK